MNEEPVLLLRDPDLYPTEEVLKMILGEIYPTYAAFMQKLGLLEIVTEFRYYNDGKAWLGKNTFKKKNLFWLSIWDGYFQVGLYFTVKTYGGVMDLSVSEDFKAFGPMVGKLMPLIVQVRQKEQLDDLVTVIAYKKSLK